MIQQIYQVNQLQQGVDFRKPEYRRELFLRFYEFNLKYKSLPGGVYYLLPQLSGRCQWTKEQELWFAFINGCTQNPCTSWVIFNEFPYFEKIKIQELESWHAENWRTLQYDIDRRYQKGHFVEMYKSYIGCIAPFTQQEYFNHILDKNPEQNFEHVWEIVFNDLYMFGRLSTFSYLEYLSIFGLPIQCNSLFIQDLHGSKSHRNGLCKVLGRDDLDWHKSNVNYAGHDKQLLIDLEIEGSRLLRESKMRFIKKEFFEYVNYFTLESCLCSFKGMFRENRRYPNVYNDMLYERIIKAEKAHKKTSFEIFWDIRRVSLPKQLLCEYNEIKGLTKQKQNWFRTTGEIIYMDIDDSTFKNNFNFTNKINQQCQLF